MRTFCATGLTALVCLSILTVSAPDPWPAAPLRIGIFLLAILAILRLRTPLRLCAGITAPLAAAALWPLLQLAAGLTVYSAATVEAALTWAANLVLFFLSVQVFSCSAVRHRCRLALLYFSLAIAVIAAIQFFTSAGKIFWIFPTRYTDQVLGPFVNRDHYAAFVELMLPLALWEALRDRRATVRYSIIAAILFASVVEGASRAGFLLVTAEIAVLVLPALIRPAGPARPVLPTVARLAAFVVLFTMVVGWQVLWRRFNDPDPWRYRRELRASALAMARERPAAGFGLNTFEAVYPAYALFDSGLIANHAHNDWVQWASEGGVNFVAFLAVIAVAAVPLAIQAPWSLGAVAVFAHGLVDFPMQKPALMACVFLLLGMAVARRRTGS